MKKTLLLILFFFSALLSGQQPSLNFAKVYGEVNGQEFISDMHQDLFGNLIIAGYTNKPLDLDPPLARASLLVRHFNR